MVNAIIMVLLYQQSSAIMFFILDLRKYGLSLNLIFMFFGSVSGFGSVSIFLHCWCSCFFRIVIVILKAQ